MKNLKQQEARKEQFVKESNVSLMKFPSSNGSSGRSILMDELNSNRREDTVLDMGMNESNQLQQRMRLINDVTFLKNV